MEDGVNHDSLSGVNGNGNGNDRNINNTSNNPTLAHSLGLEDLEGITYFVDDTTAQLKIKKMLDMARHGLDRV